MNKNTIVILTLMGLMSCSDETVLPENEDKGVRNIPNVPIENLNSNAVVNSNSIKPSASKVATSLWLQKVTNEFETGKNYLAAEKDFDIKGFNGVNATTASAEGDVVVSPYYGDGYQYVITVRIDNSYSLFLQIREWCQYNKVAYKSNGGTIYVNCMAVLQ